MPYFRKPKNADNPYAQIHNDILEDEDLSLKAKGLLAYLLSRSDDWDVFQAQLETIGPDGETAIRSGIEELMNAGYLHRFQTKNEKGQYGEYLYIICEEPRSNVDTPETRFSEIGKSETGKSETGKSSPTNTDSNQNGVHQNGGRGARARGRENAPCSVSEAVEIGSDEGIPPDVCRGWWHYYNSRGWPNPVESVRSALIVWNQREQRIQSDSAPSSAEAIETVEDIRGETFTEEEVGPLVSRFDALEREDFGFVRVRQQDQKPVYRLCE